MGIHAQNITKRFKDFTALDDVSLEVKSGELVALLGPSGSGKTTLLRVISGLETADSGTVLLDGEEAHAKNIRDRNVGFVFQHYALFKHMTVLDNVAFGLRVRPRAQRLPELEIRRKVRSLLELVHLDTFQDRYPSQLSGGQRQRVALARALAVEPKVLLLDEPFGALDAKVRKELRRWMRRLHDDIHITSIFVTHDQEEAMEVADRVVVMSNGRIEQAGTPDEVWNHPVNGFVYDFLGNYNEFEGWRDESGAVHLTEYDVTEVPAAAPASAPSGWLRRYPRAAHFVQHLLPGLAAGGKPAAPGVSSRRVQAKSGNGTPVKLYARPHEMWIAREPDGREYITATVLHINPAGALVKLELERVGGALLQAEAPKSVVAQLALRKGERILVRPKEVRIFE